MPTRSGHPYLLEESSESFNTSMNSQQIAIMFAELNAKLDPLRTFEERLAKVEATHEPPESPTGEQTSQRNNRYNNTDNTSNFDAQYLKNIKIDVPNFDGCHDPQLFID